MFSIIIPNYNNAKWLDRLFQSIQMQTYKEFEVIFVDDVSTDNSVEIAKSWQQEIDLQILELDQKRYNGGARNVALTEGRALRKYTLFIDSDDYFADEHCLEEIARIIKTNNEPDLVRLSYFYSRMGSVFLVNLGRQTTVEEIINDEWVACWTKCIKSKLIVPFPEDTLMEDVVQHIKQLDNIETIAGCEKGIVVWNRDNENSCSNNMELQDGKWRSSFYRYIADLLDLRVNKPECQAQLNKRRQTAIDNMRRGVYEQ